MDLNNVSINNNPDMVRAAGGFFGGAQPDSGVTANSLDSIPGMGEKKEAAPVTKPASIAEDVNIDRSKLFDFASMKDTKDLNRAMADALAIKKKEDPTFLDRVGLLSDCVQVENTLGYGTKGGIAVRKDELNQPVVTKNEKGEDVHVIDMVPKIVGYRIKNISDKPIEYATCVYTKKGEHLYDKAEVIGTLQPGEYADLETKYVTLLAKQPEYAMNFKNARVLRSPYSVKNMSKIKELTPSGVDDILRNFHVAFNAEGMLAHDDGIKLQISEVRTNAAGQTYNELKPEFVAAFGFLDVPEEPRARRSGGSSSTPGLSASQRGALSTAAWLDLLVSAVGSKEGE